MIPESIVLASSRQPLLGPREPLTFYWRPHLCRSPRLFTNVFHIISRNLGKRQTSKHHIRQEIAHKLSKAAVSLISIRLPAPNHRRPHPTPAPGCRRPSHRPSHRIPILTQLAAAPVTKLSREPQVLLGTCGTWSSPVLSGKPRCLHWSELQSSSFL